MRHLIYPDFGQNQSRSQFGLHLPRSGILRDRRKSLVSAYTHIFRRMRYKSETVKFDIIILHGAVGRTSFFLEDTIIRWNSQVWYASRPHAHKLGTFYLIVKGLLLGILYLAAASRFSESESDLFISLIPCHFHRSSRRFDSWVFIVE